MSARLGNPAFTSPPGRRILDDIADGICVADRAFDIVYANRAAALICRSTPEELVGRSLHAALASFGSDLRCLLHDTVESRTPHKIAGVIGVPGDRIEIVIHPDADGGVWLHLRCPEPAERLQQQLRDRDEILTMAERSAGIGVWDIDLPTETVRGTPQFWRVMGLPPTDEAMPIETTRRLRLPEDRDRVVQGFRNVLGNHAESFEMEYRIRRPDGEIRWIFGRGRLIRESDGRAIRYSGIDIDVTERKAGEAVLADLNRELEARVAERTAALEAEIVRRVEAEAQLHQAQKMETIGQLTGGIAHDFNNLLTVISGNLEALERLISDREPRMRRFALAAMRGAERAAILTRRLLAFARRQSLEPQLIDINELILGMSDLLRRAVGDMIVVEFRLAAGLPPVFADPNQFENAVLNLAVNSRDAMPDGGTLSVETVLKAAGGADGDRRTQPAGDCIAIAVRDTGAGMSDEVKRLAFEPFFTTKTSGHGTGLGLSQVYTFIKQSGGLCQLDSEPGAGTTVTLYLPVANRQPDVPRAELVCAAPRELAP